MRGATKFYNILSTNSVLPLNVNDLNITQILRFIVNLKNIYILQKIHIFNLKLLKLASTLVAC